MRKKQNKQCDVLSGQDMNGCDASRLARSSRLSWSHTLKTQTLQHCWRLGTHTQVVSVCVCPQLLTQSSQHWSVSDFTRSSSHCAHRCNKMTVCSSIVSHRKVFLKVFFPPPYPASLKCCAEIARVSSKMSSAGKIDFDNPGHSNQTEERSL